MSMPQMALARGAMPGWTAAHMKQVILCVAAQTQIMTVALAITQPDLVDRVECRGDDKQKLALRSPYLSQRENSASRSCYTIMC